MKILAIIASIILVGCVETRSSAQTCCTAAARDDKCPLRTSGPISKAEIEEAHKLVAELDTTEATKRAFYNVPDAGSVFLRSYKDAVRYGYGYSSCCGDDGSQTIDLGTNGDVREAVNTILRKRIERTTCRLRAIGVDVPRP